MTEELFCSRGSGNALEPRLYEDCGLDNIWLKDGYTIVHHGGEELIEPEDVEGLHKAIAHHLACQRKSLVSREIKFIRRALDMTQGELGASLGTTAQTVARWENGKVAIPLPNEILLRFVTVTAVSDPKQLAATLAALPKGSEGPLEGPARPVSFRHDRVWEEEMLEAA